MAFSFYSSLKSIPHEMHEVAEVYRWSPWQKLVQMELPFSAIGLVWNSMISVAAAWFYLIACEMFVLKNRDFRLPGLGSYLQTAANASDTRAIVWGLVVMIGVIVAHGPAHLAPGHRLGGEIQVRTGGKRAGPALGRSRSAEKLAACCRWLARMFIAPARERLDLALRQDSVRPSQGSPRRIAQPGGSLMRWRSPSCSASPMAS